MTTKLSQLARRRPVDAAVQLEDDGAALERELGRVRVRHVDRVRGAVGLDVAEPAAVPARRDVRDDVELLPRVEERLLEREVVARRHQQHVRSAALPQQRRQQREEPVHRRRRRAGGEHRVQLVVERARPLRQRDVLRDAGKIGRLVGRILEPVRELRGEVRHVRPQHRDEPAGGEDRRHLLHLLLRRGLGSRRAEPRLLAQDRGVQLLQLRSRIESQLVDERAPQILVRGEGIGLPSRPVQREHQLAAEPSPAADSAPRATRAAAPAPRRRRRRAPRRSDPPSRRGEAPRAGRPRSARTARTPARPAARRARARAPPAACATRSSGSRPAASCTSCSNRYRSIRSLSTSSLYPGGRVTSRSGPSSFRSEEIRFWSEVFAVRGAESPQSAAVRKSVETTSPARSSSTASTARCFVPPRGSGAPPPSTTSSGPRIRKSGMCGSFRLMRGLDIRPQAERRARAAAPPSGDPPPSRQARRSCLQAYVICNRLFAGLKVA